MARWAMAWAAGDFRVEQNSRRPGCERGGGHIQFEAGELLVAGECGVRLVKVLAMVEG